MTQPPTGYPPPALPGDGGFPPSPPPGWPGAAPALPPRKPRVGLLIGLGAGAVVVSALLALTIVFIRPGVPATLIEPSLDFEATDSDIVVEVADYDGKLLPGSTQGGAPVLSSALYTGLTRTDPVTGLPENAIAVDIFSDDGLTWTITLADKHTFHNGEAVTAQAFVDSWDFSRDTADDGVDYYFSNIDDYEALDDQTLEVTLSEPDVTFPTTLSRPVFSPMAEECLADVVACAEAPIGNGPFRFEDTSNPHQLRLARWDDYGGDPAQYGGVDVRLVSDSGDAPSPDPESLDDVDLAPVDRDAVASIPSDMSTLHVPNGHVEFLSFPDSAPFDDPEFRRSVSLAIDRQALADLIGNGDAPASSFSPPTQLGHAPESCTSCGYDPDAAAASLADSKWEDEDVELVYLDSHPGAAELAEMICRQLSDGLGVDCDVEARDAAEYHPNRHDGLALVDYRSSATHTGELLSLIEDDYEVTDDDYSSLVKSGRTASSLDDAFYYFSEAEKLLDADMAVAPLTTPSQTFGLSDAIVEDSVVFDLQTAGVRLDLLLVDDEAD
ncbi:MAG: ABC transporter substrate-binding protein [Stackebrandtia sp.]